MQVSNIDVQLNSNQVVEVQENEKMSRRNDEPDPEALPQEIEVNDSAREREDNSAAAAALELKTARLAILDQCEGLGSENVFETEKEPSLESNGDASLVPVNDEDKTDLVIGEGVMIPKDAPTKKNEKDPEDDNRDAIPPGVKEAEGRLSGYLKEAPSNGTMAAEGRLSGYLKEAPANEREGHVQATAPLDDFSRPESAVPTVALRRDVPVQMNSLPGAHALGGTHGSVPEDPSSTGVEENTNADLESLGDMTPRQSGNLAVANRVVEEEGNENLPRAEQVDRKSMEQKEMEMSLWQKRSLLGGLFFVAIIVIVAVVVTATTRGTNTVSVVGENDGMETSPPSNAQTSTPLSAEEQLLLELLPEETKLAILAADLITSNATNSTSPQEQAYLWAANDPLLLGYSDDRVLQRLALATFYFSTGGPETWKRNKDWLSYEVHECQWYTHWGTSLVASPQNKYRYIYDFVNSSEIESPCNEDNDLLEHLWLADNGLKGSFPEELYLLTSLKSIGVEKNEIGGSISSKVSHLTNLRSLGIRGNAFSGTLPSALGLLSDFELMWFASNAITGTIPTELAQLSDSLTYFRLDSLQLTGTIPTELGSLTNVDFLWLDNNALSGSIPTEIGLLTAMASLTFDNNNLLHSTVPTEIGAFSNLYDLTLQNNLFTGALPSELGLCSKLTYLTIGGNPSIDGPLPTDLGRLTLLEQFYSWLTPLSGSVPSEMGNCRSLTGFEIASAEGITGPIPSQLGLLSNLGLLHLNNNNLSGVLPSELGQMKLWRLWLDENGFSGTIPNEISGLNSTLKELRMNDNRLTGLVPSELGLLSHLQQLAVHNNSGLSGTVPSSLCYLDTHFHELDETDVWISVDCDFLECACDVCKCM